jgi:hypothetical protein
MADDDAAVVRALLRSLYEAQTSRNEPAVKVDTAALEPKAGLRKLPDSERKAA